MWLDVLDIIVYLDVESRLVDHYAIVCGQYLILIEHACEAYTVRLHHLLRYLGVSS